MKYIYTLSILAYILTTSSCQKINPTFTYEGNLFQNLEIAFTGLPENGSYYLWDFGDGNTSIGRYVRHSFTYPDSYTVTLTILDQAGNAHKVSQTLDIQPIPKTLVIKAVTIFNVFPFTSILDNAPDPNGANLYYEIVDVSDLNLSNNIVIGTSSTIADIQSLPVTWNDPIAITDLSTKSYAIRFYDNDDNSPSYYFEKLGSLQHDYAPFSSNIVMLTTGGSPSSSPYTYMELEVEYIY